MNLKLYTISGPSDARVAKARYIITNDTLTFDVTSSSDDGYVISVTIGASTTAYRLGWGYASEEGASAALEEFMTEQGIEQITREDSE
jgi:hypothetical protein